MDVLVTAASIGLRPVGGELFGTIEESAVLSTLADLAAAHPDDSDLYDDAAARVRLARCAGVERIEPGTVFAARHGAGEIQLRYRSEMCRVFEDLAIDVALRAHQPAVVLA